jgi:hypothetical protein
MSAAAGVAVSAVAIFLLASAALKLAEPMRVGQALQAAGVPSVLTGSAAIAVAVVELAVATTLLALSGGARLAAAAVVLLLFSGFLAYLATSRPGTPCGCLGDLGSTDHRTGLGRNVALLALLAVGAVGGAPRPDALAVAVGVQLAVAIAIVTEGTALARALRELSADLGVRS